MSVVTSRKRGSKSAAKTQAHRHTNGLEELNEVPFDALASLFKNPEFPRILEKRLEQHHDQTAQLEAD